MTRITSIFILIAGLTVCFGGSAKDGLNTCPSSGNKQIATTRTVVGTLTVQAPSANTGLIYFGGETVSTTRGVAINPGGAFTYPPMGNTQPYDLSNIRFACTVTADTITYNYVQ